MAFPKSCQDRGEQGKFTITTGSKLELETNQVSPESSAFQPSSGVAEQNSVTPVAPSSPSRVALAPLGQGIHSGRAVVILSIPFSAKFPHQPYKPSCRDVTLSILCQAEKTSGYSCLSLETRELVENTLKKIRFPSLPNSSEREFLNDSGSEESCCQPMQHCSSRAVCSTCFASQDA